MFNKIVLVGRVGKDPVVKWFNNADGSGVAEFALATAEQYKDREGNWKEMTDWHNIKITNKYMVKRAEDKIRKGMLILVEGKSRTRSYDSQGQTKYITEVIVDFLRICSDVPSKPPQENRINSEQRQDMNDYQRKENGQSNSNLPPDDDLPF